MISNEDELGKNVSKTKPDKADGRRISAITPPLWRKSHPSLVVADPTWVGERVQFINGWLQRQSNATLI